MHLKVHSLSREEFGQFCDALLVNGAAAPAEQGPSGKSKPTML